MWANYRTCISIHYGLQNFGFTWVYMNIATSVGKVNIVAREVSQLQNILANNNILHNNNNTISEYCSRSASEYPRQQQYPPQQQQYDKLIL